METNYKIEVKKITSWADVLDAANFTRNKKEQHKEPSEAFKKAMIKAEHSPLRCLLFAINFYDIPYYVSVHLCRHIHAQPFVSTSRPDIVSNAKPRSEQLKSDPVNMKLFLNAQEIINISKARLCNRAETETRLIWLQAIRKLNDIEPVLANACVPNCIYRGFCPEINSCGFSKHKLFSIDSKAYCKHLNI